MFIMALDVAKAYDSVHRSRALTILRHMGVANNKFFDLLWHSLNIGETVVCGGGKLGEPWLSSRGIKQGCPASPILFCLIMSGLQRYLERLIGHCSIKIGDENRLISTYADDIKIMCTS